MEGKSQGDNDWKKQHGGGLTHHSLNEKLWKEKLLCFNIKYNKIYFIKYIHIFYYKIIFKYSFIIKKYKGIKGRVTLENDTDYVMAPKFTGILLLLLGTSSSLASQRWNISVIRGKTGKKVPITSRASIKNPNSSLFRALSRMRL